jgi:hypothetical protein
MAILTLEPEDALTRRILEDAVAEELAQFAAKLETARVMFRRYPGLVEGPEFPPLLRAAYLETYDREPDDDRDEGSPDPEAIRAIELPKVIETARAVLIARAWSEDGQPSRIV